MVATDVQDMTAFNAVNNFSIGGPVVGPGSSTPLSMANLTVRRTQLIQGGSDFSAGKTPWYYDSYDDSAYWVVKGTGTSVPEGLALKDTPTQNNTAPELAGAYLGDASASFSSFQDFGAFERDGSFTALDEDCYTWEDGAITFDKELAIPEGKAVYVLVKTKRALEGEVDNATVYPLKNMLSLKEAGESDYRDLNEATLNTNGGGDLFKEAAQILTRDVEGNWKSLTRGGDAGRVATGAVSKPGTYVEYRITVNYLATLQGTYEVTDTLPEGMEAVYVRYYWADPAHDAEAPTMPAIDALEGSWTDIGLKDAAMGGRQGAQSAFAYYDKDSRQIRFDVGNLHKAPDRTRDYSKQRSIDVQVLVKVTDEDVRAGVPKPFSNSVQMASKAGVLVGRDTVTTQVLSPAISKETPGLTNGVVPFTLVVNPQAENLAYGSDPLIVEDVLSDPLAFDITTFKFADGAGNDITDSVTIHDGGRTADGNGSVMYFEIPNSTKVTITYDTVPQVKPNAVFDVSNTAYLRGFEKGAIESRKDNVKNTVTATSTTDNKASFAVAKRDKDDISVTLPGTEFSLQQATWDEDAGKWTPVQGAQALVETSGANGVATFDGLEYNTAYQLVETGAPQGYKLDSTPRYLVIAKAVNSDRYNPEYPEEVDAFAEHGATVQYAGWQMAVNAYDEKAATVKVSKVWDDGDDRDGLRPESVTVHLLADGQDTGKAVALAADGGWTGQFDGLDRTGADGRAIAYTVEEEAVRGYEEPQITGSAEGSYTITNKRTLKPKSGKADDNGNQVTPPEKEESEEGAGRVDPPEAKAETATQRVADVAAKTGDGGAGLACAMLAVAVTAASAAGALHRRRVCPAAARGRSSDGTGACR